jgi:hypothetical protein
MLGALVLCNQSAVLVYLILSNVLPHATMLQSPLTTLISQDSKQSLL